MSLVKRIDGDYIIKSVSSLANVIVDTNTLVVRGNLDIIGTASKLESVETIIYDNIITLNGNVSGTPVLNAGIEVRRGTSPTVAFRWNEIGMSWEVTSDGTSFNNVLDASTQGVFLRKVSDDPTPSLGGNLDSNAFSITSSVDGIVKFDANIAIKYTQTTPLLVAGYNLLHANIPAGGGSGLYITNSSTSNQELITKTKAIVYSIIM